MSVDEYHRGWKEKLDAVSPSFCLAKWKQLTLHLQTGHKHSCHHPPTHKIDIKAIEDNPSALHNTEFSKHTRQQMLDGVRPVECGYCWKAEDSGSLSDRVYKSATKWANEHFDSVKNNPSTHDTFPSYLEVSFSNVCNFKCIYCAPNISSQWYQEVQKYGGYKMSYKGRGHEYNSIEQAENDGLVLIKNRDENPYVDAFWKWWPELYNHLNTFRITGGEPLLTKDTNGILDHILTTSNPNKNLKLGVNTNMCVPSPVYNTFLNKLNDVIDRRLTSVITLFTSCEAHGSKAEYIRTGLNYDTHLSNVKQALTMLCEHKQDIKIFRDQALYNHVSYMCTFNLLSVTSFKRFLEDLVEIKKGLLFSDNIMKLAQYVCETKPAWVMSEGRDKFYSFTGPQEFLASKTLTIDIPFLRHPRWLCVDVLTDDFDHYFEECYQYMNDCGWFTENERDKMLRVWNVYRNSPTPNEEKRRTRKYFQQYVDKLDERRDTKFLDVFPEYNQFYNYCRSLPG